MEGAGLTGERRVGYLGLGSNVGDPEANLRAGLAALQATRGIEVEAVSSLYRTEPVGEVTDQPDFLNACARIATTLGPERLLEGCRAVERALGREPGGPRHAPRPLDVDLLLLEGGAYASERLALPHREVATRRFVLVPLLELDPELELPDGTRLAGALSRLQGQRVELAGPPPPLPPAAG